jgi:hypothetical protein
MVLQIKKDNDQHKANENEAKDEDERTRSALTPAMEFLLMWTVVKSQSTSIFALKGVSMDSAACSARGKNEKKELDALVRRFPLPASESEDEKAHCT